MKFVRYHSPNIKEVEYLGMKFKVPYWTVYIACSPKGHLCVFGSKPEWHSDHGWFNRNGGTARVLGYVEFEEGDNPEKSLKKVDTVKNVKILSKQKSDW